MADGTPLDVIESGGDVDNAADAARMAQLMRDVNSSGGLPDTPQTMNMAPVSAPPMRQSSNRVAQAPPPQYTPVDDDYRPQRRKNVWGSISGKLRDPLIVSVIVFVLSLPVLHTMLAKYVGWAFAVGGQLSWLGLIAMSVLAGLVFGLTQGISDLVGL
jgi:hypothetical protein